MTCRVRERHEMFIWDGPLKVSILEETTTFIRKSQWPWGICHLTFPSLRQNDKETCGHLFSNRTQTKLVGSHNLRFINFIYSLTKKFLVFQRNVGNRLRNKFCPVSEVTNFQLKTRSCTRRTVLTRFTLLNLFRLLTLYNNVINLWRDSLWLSSLKLHTWRPDVFVCLDQKTGSY